MRGTGLLTTGSRSVRATVAALAGQVNGVSAQDSTLFSASLTIDSDADVPNVPLLQPGSQHRAVVQVGPNRAGSEPRWLCIKIPDAHGKGSDQDFVLASSGDGAPLHHAVLPSAPVAALYSSLWLYLAGLQPVLFGVKPPDSGPEAQFSSGDELSFAISPPVGKFRPIGTLALQRKRTKPVEFSGSASGGGIRPLPPVNFY